MKNVSKRTRFAVTIGLAALLGGCAGQQQVAQPHGPYGSPVGVVEAVPAPPPHVVYAPRPFYGSGYGYYDDYPYSAPPSLALTVFGGGFGPAYRDRRGYRDDRDRDDRRRARNRDDDRAGQSREERRALREERRTNRRDAVVPAANREERRRDGAREDRGDASAERGFSIRPGLAERRRLRRKLLRERRAALREGNGSRGNVESRGRGDGPRAERRRDRAADTE